MITTLKSLLSLLPHPSAVQQPEQIPSGYASSNPPPHDYYLRQHHGGSTPYSQPRYSEPFYSYPPPLHAQRAPAQLPTPTSPSDAQTSPVYSHYDYPQNAYGHYTSSSNACDPTPSVSNTSSLLPHGYAASSHNRDLRALPSLTIPEHRTNTNGPAPLPSPDLSKVDSGSPFRGSLPLSSTFVNRLSPPISDARDELRSSPESPSPPRSPQSAVSSSSVPGGKQVQLAPLRTLLRGQAHRYRRDKFDSSALRAFSSRKPSE